MKTQQKKKQQKKNYSIYLANKKQQIMLILKWRNKKEFKIDEKKKVHEIPHYFNEKSLIKPIKMLLKFEKKAFHRQIRQQQNIMHLKLYIYWNKEEEKEKKEMLENF